MAQLEWTRRLLLCFTLVCLVNPRLTVVHAATSSSSSPASGVTMETSTPDNNDSDVGGTQSPASDYSPGATNATAAPRATVASDRGLDRGLDSSQKANDTSLPARGSWEPVPERDLVARQQLIPFYALTNSFLGTIQPRVLTDLRHLIDFSDRQKTVDNLKTRWREVATYFIGFCVCVAIGLFLLICMPFTGLITCCCRCCCNSCGGKVNPRDRKTGDCARCCCGFLLFAFVAFVLAGGIIMAFLSGDISARLTGTDSVYDVIGDRLDDVAVYANDTIRQVRSTTLDRYRKTSETLLQDMDGIIPEVDQKFGAGELLEDMKTFSKSLDAVNQTLYSVQANKRSYTINRSVLEESMNTTKDTAISALMSCSSDSCNKSRTRLEGLVVLADVSNIDVDNITLYVLQAVQQGLDADVDKAIGEYQRILSNANDTLQEEVVKVRDMSAKVEKQINDVINEYQERIDPSVLTHAADTVRTVKEKGIKDWYMNVPYVVCLTLAVFIIIITACYFTGLMFGATGKMATSHKSSSCCTWRTGACWLVTGLILTFFFYWLLLLVLIAFFLAGGLSHTELCRHAYNLPNSPIAGMIDEAVQSQVNMTFNLSETYVACWENKSLYQAFKLEENGVNLSTIINKDEIYQAIDKVKDVNVEIGAVNFVPADSRDALIEMGASIDSVLVSLGGWVDATRQPVTSDNVASVAGQLEQTAAEQNNDSLLLRSAEELRNQSSLAAEMETIKSNLREDLERLQQLLSRVSFTNTVSGLIEAQSKINSEGNTIAQRTINGTADRAKDRINTTITAMEEDIREDLGRCGPVYTSASGIVNEVCVRGLYTVNAYWSSLGMALIFLLPAILCAFKLVTLYRRSVPHNALEAIDNDLYMSAYHQETPPHYPPYHPKDQQSEMLLHRVDRPKSDYIAMADNPVFQPDELPYQIPRAILRQGTQVLPARQGSQMVPVRPRSQAHPAAPDDAYFYAMPARGMRTPPPQYRQTVATGV